ncbi:MAG: translocation/assembly module TamB, partial [Chloroherpetonaceae bacterium]|nr:translocation/assembly module TamB [Chloroherpetonaceae bacterium]
DRLTRELQRKSRRHTSEEELSSISDSMLALPPLSVRYKLSFKSLSKIALMLRSGYFNAIGSMEGRIESQANRCLWHTSLTIDSLRYGTILAARTLSASLRYSDDLQTDSTQRRTFHNLNALLQANVFRMKIGDQRFVKTALRAKYAPSDLDVNLRTTHQNTRGLFDLDAEVRTVGDQYVIQLRDATFATQNYFWQNDANAQIIISRDLVKFENLRFINNEQEIVVLGEFRLTGQSELSFRIQDFSLSDIRQFFFDSPNTKLGGTLNLTMNLTGNFISPVITLTSTLDNFFYETIDIGHLDFAGRYENKRFTFELGANTDSARYRAFNLPLKPYTHIRGEGRLPIDLSINAEERLLQNEDVWVEIACPDLSPTILEFAAPVQRVSGAIGLRITYFGRFPSPTLKAVLTAQDVHATTTASSVEYIINGSADITPNLVQWRSVDVRDKQGGLLRTSGTVRMSDFDVQRFDIQLSFSQLLLYDKPAGRSEELIGRLIASSDELRFSGTMKEPVLSGTLRLDGGRLTQFRSGSSKGSQIVEASKFITTIVEEDTSLEARLRRNPKLNLTLDEEFELSETARAIRSAYKASFVDELSMSLRIATVQPLSYTLVFDRFLGEQLDALIEDMALTINKQKTTYRVFGSASITSGRYNFYGVAFNIEPGATMRWLGGGLTDAVLDIFARYQTRVLSTTRNELDNIILRPHIGGTVDDTQIEISYILNERTYRAPGTRIAGEEDPNAALNFITLLTARRWYAPPGSASGGSLSGGLLTGVGLSAGAGLLSSQITRLASAIQGVQAVNIDFARDRSGQVAGVDFSLEYAVPGTDGRLVVTGSGSTAAVDSLGRTNNAISNSQRLEYRISRNLVLEAFRNYGPNNFNLFNNTIAEVWGIGISYRETFHTWGEFGERWNAYFDAFTRWLSGSKSDDKEKKPTVDSTIVPNAVSRVTVPSRPTPTLQDSAKATRSAGADSTAAPIAVPAPASDSTAVSRRRLR